MNQKKIFTKFSLSILIVLLAYSCARMSSPTGGAKDEDPPIPIKSKPLNYSTNFMGDKIIIQFDEFVVLKNIQQELLVSPPVLEDPEIKQRGKNLIININNKLKDSTTYNFNFYNSIVDLNENIPLPNFQFEFSTGSVFDSIYLGGTVKNAFDYATEASLYVMAYEVFNDTMPRTTIPDYVAKTDADGHFFITNLKNKPYYLFALKDMNSNMLFDLPNESIAFLDSTFQAEFMEIITTDTIKILDSLALMKRDTIYLDSLVVKKEIVTTIGDIQLFLFTEDFKKQYRTETSRPNKALVVFAFNRELKDSISIIPISEKPYMKDWFIQEPFETNDSLVYWLSDSVLYNNDSLLFQLNYTMKDSNNIDYIKTDTAVLEFDFEEKADLNKESAKEDKKKSGRFNLGLLNKDEKEVEEKDTLPPPSLLTFTHNAKTPFELNKAVELVSVFPIDKINESLIEFYNVIDDTVFKTRAFVFKHSETELRKYFIDFEKDSEEKFKLLIPAGTFTDIYGNINDSLTYDFTTRDVEYYSNISLILLNVKEKAIVQLLDEKEKLIEKRVVYFDSVLTYDYLAPKKYIFKLFLDSNNNDQWDTGNLNKMLQPELVFYFPEEVETKSNWDMEYEWDLYPVPLEVTPAIDSLPQELDKGEPENQNNE
ncbi:MAG: Ig-like domain-containing protein [Salinivirgaceae bacterium]|nr:Ig-like domain-containing protein [Salinivirgaceae bacterium]